MTLWIFLKTVYALLFSFVGSEPGMVAFSKISLLGRFEFCPSFYSNEYAIFGHNKNI
jgi:hypothetical protein